MSPISKAHSLTFAIATPAVFSIWKIASDFYGFSWITDLLVTAIISASFYNFIYKILLLSCQRLHPLKKWLLGRSYIEGLWIGYYTSNGVYTYYYEFFEQTLESTSIKGTGVDKDNNCIGTWTILHPYINVDDSKMTYYYEMDELCSPDVTLGYAKATIHWDKGQNACKLTGFAVDSFSAQKEGFVSIKVNLPNKLELQQKWLQSSFYENVQKLADRQYI